ncbi:peptide chain release factor N(5)-glutamine methyltransferase [Ferruginibacter sp. SUN002]|uniref:peptide chain release factor N(5)-glutamine methyltransferase n=1 Tax=Ferruginibacter sp. SUN002 TaxID=2937789 RepID=UPI003D36B320
MTIRTIYRNFQERLLNLYNINEATIITDWLMENIGQFSKTDILLTPDKEISKTTRQRIETCLQELLEHKPIQYVIGQAWFYNMKLKVNKHVLIPRPETEELVKIVTDHLRFSTYDLRNSSSEIVNILDIGTGSGCIPIAIKKDFPHSTVTAIDISENSLDLAKENSIAQNTSINFIEFDFLDESKWQELPTFDVIVSNPPYIPVSEKERLDKNVTEYEPYSALFVPNDRPLLFYEKIAAFGRIHLNNNGKIFVEIHENFGKETAALFASGYENVEIKKDLSGKERFVIATLFR